MGIYFLETGANQRPSKVVYDRAWSAIAQAKPGDIDWDKALEGVEWFHITGITPAISKSAMELSLESVKEAKKRGITVSCDLNYRKNLWKYGKRAAEVMRELANYVDVAIANEEDVQKALEITTDVVVESGELDLALLDPRNAQNFAGRDGFVCYDMQTADYRGILFNFQHDYWTANRDLIPAVCYALDRQSIIDSVLLGQGMAAYGPLQRNMYNNESVEHYDYDPAKAREILETAGCTMGPDGYYQRGGTEVGFLLSVMPGEQDRIDIAQAAAQQLREAGIHCTVELPAQIDWAGQMAGLIGWGSPFDADDHTYKVFGSGKGANYNGYSNPRVDEYLTLARQSSDPETRRHYYAKFQEELASDPPYAFLCYIDANYVAKSTVQGISASKVLGHHGVGIFWNIHQWTLDESETQ